MSRLLLTKLWAWFSVVRRNRSDLRSCSVSRAVSWSCLLSVLWWMIGRRLQLLIHETLQSEVSLINGDESRWLQGLGRSKTAKDMQRKRRSNRLVAKWRRDRAGSTEWDESGRKQLKEERVIKAVKTTAARSGYSQTHGLSLQGVGRKPRRLSRHEMVLRVMTSAGQPGHLAAKRLASPPCRWYLSCRRSEMMAGSRQKFLNIHIYIYIYIFIQNIKNVHGGCGAACTASLVFV